MVLVGDGGPGDVACGGEADVRAGAAGELVGDDRPAAAFLSFAGRDRDDRAGVGDLVALERRGGPGQCECLGVGLADRKRCELDGALTELRGRPVGVKLRESGERCLGGRRGDLTGGSCGEGSWGGPSSSSSSGCPSSVFVGLVALLGLEVVEARVVRFWSKSWMPQPANSSRTSAHMAARMSLRLAIISILRRRWSLAECRVVRRALGSARSCCCRTSSNGSRGRRRCTLVRGR